MDLSENDCWLVNNELKFWSACLKKRCRRAKSCHGDAVACHNIFWPVVPEAVKLRWRALFDAHRDGRSIAQARRAIADADMRFNRAQKFRSDPSSVRAESGGRETNA